MNTSIRVRYAPSPTGRQHIGGLRTALFNYLFASSQKNQGKDARFILRIEDTDRSRSEAHYIQDIYEALEWMGIQPDEGPLKPDSEPNEEHGKYSQNGEYGPYVQSERVSLYRDYAQQLVKEGRAYYCFCSPERLEKLRREQTRSKSSLQGYDRRCRNLPTSEATTRCGNGESCVIRFAIPLEGSAGFTDLLLGQIERKNSDISPDPVILKADGFPTYHLANVIDDHLMQISHVLRAQEWLSSTPLHILLYEAFGWQPPEFCHLPMVMGQDANGKLSKLSKRHGSTSFIEFRKAGYLKEAVTNYLGLLGWAFDDKTELFHLEELEQVFDLAKLSRSPATFDYQKLDWFNGHYIRQSGIEELKCELKDFWCEQMPQIYGPLLKNENRQNFDRALGWILPLLRERAKRLSEIPAMAAYFFVRPEHNQPELALPKKCSAGETVALLQRAAALLEQLCNPAIPSNFPPNSWTDFPTLLAVKAEWEAAFRSAADEAKVKLGPFMQPLRYAVTGSKASPPLLESMLILQRQHGAKELIERIEALASQLG